MVWAVTFPTQGGRRSLHGLERVFAVAGFPVAVVATHAWALHLMSRGIDPALATAPPIVAHYLLLACAERIWPWHRSWLRSRGDLRTDVGLFVTNTIGMEALPAFPMGFWANLAAPFRWDAVVRASGGNVPSPETPPAAADGVARAR